MLTHSGIAILLTCIGIGWLTGSTTGAIIGGIVFATLFAII